MRNDIRETIVRAIISGEMKDLNPHCEGPKFSGWIKSVAEASVNLKETGDSNGAARAADDLNEAYLKLVTTK